LNNKVLKELEAIVGKEDLLVSETGLFLYGYDAGIDRAIPDAVVFPRTVDEVSQIVRLASRHHIPFLPRGSGTNLSGGTIPVCGGIVVVEPGVNNLDLQNVLAPLGYLYPPDPASQKVSTIGGNIGEDSGGPHCIKYGVTSNHVLGLEVVLSSGDIVNLGGKVFDPDGYNLHGLLIGSEGTLGIITRAVLRIVRQPESIKTILAIFNGIVEAGDAVSNIIAEGIIPATLEMMDRTMIQAVEASMHAGYPLDAGAVLIIELDGLRDGQDRIAGIIKDICSGYGAKEVKESKSAKERDELWAGRRGALGSITRLSPSYIVNDGTVPRTKLPEVLKRVEEIGKKYSLSIGNVFHAGDGNLHPNVMYDDRKPEEKERALKASYEILQACVELGGTISGEHGIGTEKLAAMPFVFNESELNAMWIVKDIFDPQGLCNPGKVLPEKVQRDFQPAKRDGKDFFKSALIFPENVEEVSTVLSLANANNISVLPSGYGSKYFWGGVPHRVEVILSTSLLTGILDYDPANLTITAMAGTKLEDLQKELSKKRQFLPLDPPFFTRCSLGGLAATNLSGPRRFLYGSPLDNVLGLEAVLADGEIVRFGGKTVKNVSGYAMSKLFVGSWGSLGVITQLTFKLSVQPEKSATLLIFSHDISDLAGLVNKILNSNLLPSAMELINPAGLKVLNPALGGEGYALSIVLEGYAEAVKRQVSELSGLGSQDTIRLLEGEEKDNFWKRVSEITNLLPGEETVVCKADVVLSKVSDMMAAFEKEIPEVLLLGSGGSGTIWGVLTISNEDPERTITALHSLRTQAKNSGGYFTVLAGPKRVKEKVRVWDDKEDCKEYDLMRMIKMRFDPKGILSPGRFID
jgi:glycolate oxidase subunit GlcD